MVLSDIIFQYGFDPFATVLAMIALLLTWSEIRRNNRVMLKIQECTAISKGSVHENNSETFHEFKVLIRNRGVPLRRIAMSLDFTGPSGVGRLNFPLRRRNPEADSDGEFSRGMIAEFTLKSYEIDEIHAAFLLQLENPTKQDAWLCIFSQGYWASDFRIGGFGDRLKTRWNNVAVRINMRFKRKVGQNEQGQPILRYYQVLPVFRVLVFPLKFFIDSLRKTHRFRVGA